MYPTIARLSKASRAPLTGKKANKDFYKGTRQAFLPGGHRTGAPGKHVVGGKAKYRLIDEKVRVFVAPPIETINSSPLKPYVSVKVNLTKEEERLPYGRFRHAEGLTPEHFLRVSRERYRMEQMGREFLGAKAPSWLNALQKVEKKRGTPVLPPKAPTPAATA
ncbi:hypothetical protein CC1G_08597 [Coprinopsis cinerea okayama7|uniref:Uncharacterized protein n=1 Tax=Coprinopsis cinerea (strain Okayama-7 / 130 / ATCC MYA-4618 / FGSC 9003) TaxID=240176 RepID=A8NCW9_COPC7|nr:hypothetical protein CC1G_08597 [Coprinopsis cinerea okayama7\|eukprot:XP_001832647.1 hypothetical protein CC1G_08597 [Coprinopsis cinerea okayama7\